MDKNKIDLSVEHDAVGDLIEMFSKTINNLTYKVSLWKELEDNEYSYQIEFRSQQIKYLKKYKRELMKRWNQLQEEIDKDDE